MKNQTLSLARLLAALAAGAAALSSQAQLTNPPPLPVITLAAADGDAGEPSNPGLFRLFRHGPTNDTLHVALAIGGSASNGVDYAALPNVVAIPAGHREVGLPVNPIDDPLIELTESVSARLLLLPGVLAYVIGNPSNAVVTIRDNDQPPPTNRPPVVNIFSPMNNSVFVAPANVHVAANAYDPDMGDHVVSVEFFDGIHHVGTDFLPPFGMVLSNVPPGEHVLRALARDTHGAVGSSMPVRFIVVTNLPPPPTNAFTVVSIQALDGIAAEGTNSIRWTNFCAQPYTNFCGTNIGQRLGTNNARFIVRRHGPTNDSLLVHYRIGGSASNGVDYAGLPGAVEIPAGRRAAEIVLQPIDDLRPEPLENVVLGLRPPPNWNTNLPPPYGIGFPTRAAAVIVDNDGPRPPICRLPDHSFHLVHPGTNGTWVRIECSTNLIHWTALCTNQVTDGAVHHVDPDADGRPNCYYRVRPCPPPPPDY